MTMVRLQRRDRTPIPRGNNRVFAALRRGAGLLTATFLMARTLHGAGAETTSLADALANLQREGLRLVFSEELVRPDMEVDAGGQRGRAALDRWLEPFGLEVRSLADGTLVVVQQQAERKAERSVLGRVVSAHSGEPLVGALLVAHSNGSAVARAVSLANGAYELPPLAPGTFRVHVDAPGYARRTLTLSVPEGVPGTLAVELDPLPLVEDTIVVRANETRLFGGESTSPTALDRAEVEAMPHLGGDPFRALVHLPGVAADDRSARLSLRGGRADELQVVLDGQEIYEPFHLQDFGGALGVVPMDALSNASLSTGNYGVSAGDRMGGLLQLVTSPGEDGARSLFSASLLNASALRSARFAEDRGSYLVSARRGSIDLAGRLLGREDPDFWDALGRVDFSLGVRHQLRANHLEVDDSLRFTEELDDESKSLETSYRSRYSWLTHQGVAGRRVLATTGAARTRLRQSRMATEDEEEQQFALIDRRNVDIDRLTSEVDWSLSPAASLTVGAQWLRYDVEQDHASAVERELVLRADGLPPGVTLAPNVRSFEGSRSIDADHRSAWATVLSRPSSSFTLDLGLRFDDYEWSNERRVSPRVSAAWRVGERTLLRAAAGRYLQSQRPYELALPDGEDELARVEVSDQFTLGLERVFEGSLVRVLKAEAYRREIDRARPRFESLFEPHNVFPELEIDRVRLAPERSEAQGLELLVRGQFSPRTSFRASAAWSQTRDHFGGAWVDRQIDQPFALQLGLETLLGRAWRLAIAWRYHSGWRTTPFFAFELDDTLGEGLPEDGEEEEIEDAEDQEGEDLPDLGVGLGALASDRLSDYHRLDLRLSRTFDLRRGRLQLFFEVQNVYDRKNLGGFDLAVDDGVLVADPELSTGILPSAGVRWEF